MWAHRVPKPTAMRWLRDVYKILGKKFQRPLFFFPNPCNHSLLHAYGGFARLRGLRGC